ncbi:D-xylose ABC transporter ATP-binding protein [Terrimonas sp.]|uniref:sugar ABC transporter ATP-binding protein n=1 Tax=Terrimonas sp. TaxID=1914338 RepID=UPI000D515704|nr:sugar ABC transporter ATP-binding protein [Terrimonas sp.]PVD50758.1 D-xylose ABC transporter ATP-binding protein [Terrimonas sp.]
MDSNFLLSVEGVSKSFPGVKALNNVQLNIEKGKVHALMGENGAGKSTLMKILIGMLQPDSGKMIFKGEQVRFSAVHEAIAAGFSMIHQELLPFPELTVAENIFMGREPVYGWSGWINRKKLYADAKALMNKLGVTISVNRLMKTLSVAEMQMVEIAKAIVNKAEVIIMDEPTSAISGREVDILFNIIHDLKKEGIAIIYISHKMDEIFKIADTISVMRDGEYIGTYPAASLNNQQLINLIVGRELNTVFEKRAANPGAPLLSVQNLCSNNFADITFEVRQGEILGIAGLMGAGRTEIVQAIFGIDNISSGIIKVKGREIKIACPGDAIHNGIGLISEDRKLTGLVLSSSVKHNITLAALKKTSPGIFLDLEKEKKVADDQVRKFNIKTPSSNQVVNYLSGGNQQKVVIAKVLLNDPDIIIFDEPTRGIDIGAKTEIYKMITELAGKGKAIIMISSELIEVLGLSDRILVVRKGRISKELNKEEATQEVIMEYAME